MRGGEKGRGKEGKEGKERVKGTMVERGRERTAGSGLTIMASEIIRLFSLLYCGYSLVIFR